MDTLKELSHPLRYVDEAKYDFITATWYCYECHKPLVVRDEVVADHTQILWKHYGFILYPQTQAKDSTDHPLEGVVAKAARVALAPIPKQTNTKFCSSCLPKFKPEGCGGCGKAFEFSHAEYSIADCLDRHSNGINDNYRVIYFHGDCLPALFSEVRKYKTKFGNTTYR